MIHFTIFYFKFFEISEEIFLPPWSLFKTWLYTYSYLDNKALFDNHQKSRPFFVCHHHNKIFFQNQNIHKIVDWIYFVPVPMFLLTWLLKKEDFQQCKIEKYNQSDVANLQQPENQTFCGKKGIKKIVKIIVFIFFSLSAFFISITLYTSLNTKVVYIKVLRITSIKDLIMHNVIPIIYIAGSDNLFSFVKNEFWEIIKLCKCRNNQIEPAMFELNVV